MPGLIKLTGTTFTNLNLKPGNADQLLSLYPAGNLLAVDFSNPTSFPAQAVPVTTGQVFKNLGGGSDIVLTRVSSASEPYIAQITYSGGGLNFLNANAGGNPEASYFRTAAPRLNLSGKKKALFISWVNQVDLGSGRQFFAGILSQSRTANGASPASDLAQNSWSLHTVGSGIGGRFLIFAPSSSQNAGISFSSTWTGKRQIAVYVDYTTGTIQGYVNGVALVGATSFSTATFGTGFPTVTDDVAIGSWTGSGQWQGAFQGKHYRHLVWDMENSTYDPAQIVARDYEFNNAKFS